MVKKKTTKIQIKDKPSISLTKWDQLSQNYFIAVWIDGTFSLFDSESEKEMQLFDKQSAGISSLVWIKSIPGGFATSNEKIAAIKLWSVSSRTPLKTIKAGFSGILNMVPLPARNKITKEGLLLSFKDSCVGLMDFEKKKMEFLSGSTHAETVFDIQFSHANKDNLATGSYDGQIKVWNIDKMSCMATLQNPNSEKKFNPVYGISWSPSGSEIVTVHSSGEVLLWDWQKNRLLSSVKPCNGQPILRVEWNNLRPELIASGSMEGLA
jgi:WD40 repeat protein